MTELEIEELEWNFAESDISKEEKSADDISDNFGEEVRDILAASRRSERYFGSIKNFKKEEVVIIEEIAKVLGRRQKDKLPALRDVPNDKEVSNVRQWRTERKYIIE